MLAQSNRSWPQACLTAFAGVTCVLFGWALWRGQDVNWDWQNYHLYDAFALLHGRFERDVAPGGSQSFLNPLPYLLPYIAQRLLPPLAAGLVVTASQVVAVMVAWAIAWRAWGGQSGRGLVAGIAALCACTGASMLTEIGTTFSDVVLAAPVLLGLFLLLPDEAQPLQQERWPRFLAAGMAVGFAVGMKPTTLFLLPALAAAALAAWPPRTLVPVVGGAALGGALSDGAWALALWRDYASPVFPFMNTIFHSPSAARVDFSDPRYYWQGIGHALWLPWALARGTDATGEVVVRDLRFIVGLPLALFILALRARRRTPDPLDMLAIWLLAGTGFWMLLCPIQRYAVSLEMVASVLIVVSVARFAARAAISLRPQWIASAAALLVLSATTRSAEMFHHSWFPPFVARVPKEVPKGATYGLLKSPLGYWVTEQPRPEHAFGLLPTLMETGGVLQRRLDAMLAQAGDRLWLINLDGKVGTMIRAEMGIHGIALAPPCLRTPSPVWIDTVFCRGKVVGPRADAASNLGLDDPVAFTASGTGLIYEIDGWNETDSDGVWAIGPTAVLAFHPDAPAPDKLLLTATLSAVPGTPQHRIMAVAGGGTPQAWLPGNDKKPYSVCIGPERLQGDVVLVRLATNDVRSLSQLGVNPEVRNLAFRLYGMMLQRAPAGACS